MKILLNNGATVKKNKKSHKFHKSQRTTQTNDDSCKHNKSNIPSYIYDDLPPILGKLCYLIERRHLQEVFLISALPVIAGHIRNVLINHVDGYYSPDIYVMIVAGPATGKGFAIHSKKLGSALDNYLLSISTQGLNSYNELSDKEKQKNDEPEIRSLYIPANSSSRAFYDALHANKGSGIIFETEFDTMLNSTKQDWGNYSVIIRNAFHHEPISINRKGLRYYIDKPKLSICMTGTFDQFKRMFQSAENGLYSRYGLFTFNTVQEWQSHKPTHSSKKFNQLILETSELLFQLYEILDSREKPLFVNLDNKQWNLLDDTFSEKMQRIKDAGLSDYLLASNNRVAIMALRMSAIFSVLRIFEKSPSELKNASSIEPTESDLRTALEIAQIFVDHSIGLYSLLPSKSNTKYTDERYLNFFHALPKEFKTSLALGKGNEFDIPDSTIKRWLRKNTSDFKKIKRGQYTKI